MPIRPVRYGFGGMGSRNDSAGAKAGSSRVRLFSSAAMPLSTVRHRPCAPRPAPQDLRPRVEFTTVRIGVNLAHRLRNGPNVLTSLRESATLEPESSIRSRPFPRPERYKALVVGDRQSPISGHFSVIQPGIKAYRAAVRKRLSVPVRWFDTCDGRGRPCRQISPIGHKI